jgi:NADH-quinone oxidoreductase subunit N
MPELVLFIGTVLIMLVSLYRKEGGLMVAATGAPLLAAGSLYLLLALPLDQGQGALLHGMIVVDSFALFVKGLLLSALIMVLVLSHFWLSVVEEKKFEFYILSLLATLGMMLMVSAHHLIAVYMAIELVSLSLYVLASFRRDEVRSTEAGIKYFVLGSLASGIMLFGMSFIYGFTGAADFDTLRVMVAELNPMEPATLAVIFGLVMMIVGFAFKISAAPFHMWTPDVYEGAPTPVTSFFSTAPKIAAIALFARLLLDPFMPMFAQWQQVVLVLSVLSMLLGAFGALTQNNIKRMLAYSSIGHVGYALIGIATGTVGGLQAILIYLPLYVLSSMLAFGCVLLMQRKGKFVENIDELGGLGQTHPYMAFALSVAMFSMAGIPPLAGFFGKFYVFLAALDAGLFYLAVIGVLSSVVAAFYYLRVVKVMYFDSAKEPFDFEMGMSFKYLLFFVTLLLVCFFLAPTPLVEISGNVAQALWQ